MLLTRLVAALEEVLNGLWSRFLNKDRPNMNNNKDVFKNVQVGIEVSTGKGQRGAGKAIVYFIRGFLS